MHNNYSFHVATSRHALNFKLNCKIFYKIWLIILKDYCTYSISMVTTHKV